MNILNLLKRRRIGIDLGTSSVAIFVPNQGIVLYEPSIVVFSKSDKSKLYVGKEAKYMVDRTHGDIETHYPIRGGVIADYRTARIMLRYFLKKALDKWTILKPDGIVSVPSSVTQTERRAITEVLKQSGLGEVYVVKEPVLAAIGANIPIGDAKGCMIVDMGGGVTDIAIISLGGIVASSSVKCGGNDIDKSIIEHIRKTHKVLISTSKAERIKRLIGTVLPVSRDQVIEISGRNIETGLPKKANISANELSKPLISILDEVIEEIKFVLHKVPPELASDVLDLGIILVGGGSQLNNLHHFIEINTGISVNTIDKPHTVVANGTKGFITQIKSYRRNIL